MPVEEMFFSIIFMLLVALLEKVVFRGFLFRAIEKHNTTKIAVILSGATFGFGHIVNLLNGYSGINQLIQIVLALMLGIVLSVLFVRTKTIVPGIVFHFLFNTASSLSVEGTPIYNLIATGIILLISMIYLLYLVKII